MKMKKNFLSATLMVVFMLTATNSQAQSWADLLNKDNISKVVNAITGNTETIDMPEHGVTKAQPSSSNRIIC